MHLRILIRSKHWIWVILIFLAFTFDTLITNVYGVVGLATLIVFHFYNDLLKKKSLILSELSGVASAILLNILFINKLKSSYITPEFSFYLLGMLIATVVVSTIFRGVKIIDENSNDSDGIFER
ncbi:MAG: hypothetical protein PWQ20_1349, partial [Thermotogaceae bacterium]|nr:hypothetical protein [Thermotogaceae bacterium]